MKDQEFIDNETDQDAEHDIIQDADIVRIDGGKKKFEVISGLFDGSTKLSHSSFWQFQKSPKHFIDYKLGRKEQTPAMLKGNVIHCLILEPDEFENRYIVEPTGPDVPRKPSISQINAKKKSDSTIESIAFWNDFQENAAGREIITSALKDQAERTRDAVYRNEPARFILDAITQTEIDAEWSAFGFKWRGKIDGKGSGIIVDLKTVADADPFKIERSIRYDGMGQQSAHYTTGARLSDHNYFIIAVDAGMNITVFEIEKKTRSVFWDQIGDAVVGLRRCMAFNQWDQSFDFWADQSGFYKI